MISHISVGRSLDTPAETGGIKRILTIISCIPDRTNWSEPLRVDNELSNFNSWRDVDEEDEAALRSRIQDSGMQPRRASRPSSLDRNAGGEATLATRASRSYPAHRCRSCLSFSAEETGGSGERVGDAIVRNLDRLG